MLSGSLRGYKVQNLFSHVTHRQWIAISWSIEGLIRADRLL
jgi:hypothetical protein